MKRLIVLAGFYCVSGSFQSAAQTQEPQEPGLKLNLPAEVEVSPGKVEAKVLEIRRLARAIDADKSLKQVVLQAGLRASFDPKLTRFTTSDGEVKKLAVMVKGDHGVTREIYYFHEDFLFFIKAEDEFWQFEDISKMTGKKSDAPTVNVVSRLWYYYEGGRCIRVAEKEVEAKEEKGLVNQLKKVKNTTLEIGPAAAMYQKQSSLIRGIVNEATLKAYLKKRFQEE